MFDLTSLKEHEQAQLLIARLGQSRGYRCYLPAGDRSRDTSGQLAAVSLDALPEKLAEHPAAGTLRVIDCLWLDRDDNIVQAHEVELSTSLPTGLARLGEMFEHFPDALATVTLRRQRLGTLERQLRKRFFARLAGGRLRGLPLEDLLRCRPGGFGDYGELHTAA